MVRARTVIVADDDEDIRECVAGVLRDEGLDVHVAHHGRAALDLLERLGDHRCVLLLDLMMPVMNGHEVLGLLEKAGRTPRLPVIVCSASKERDAIPSGARHVIRKPIDLDRLLTLVGETCDAPEASELRLRLESEVDDLELRIARDA
jgi:CheY-like chemotaxis protein